MADLLLLCRHISRGDKRGLLAATTKMRAFPGRKVEPAAEPTELVAVAETLAEVLALEDVRLTAITHAPSKLATIHATWLGTKLAENVDSVNFSLSEETDLDPACFMKWSGLDPADALLRKIVTLIDGAHAGNGDWGRAVLIVGHMPQLGWLAARVLRNKPWWSRILAGGQSSLALKNGEVAAIALTGALNGRAQGHLEWTISPDETVAIEALRDKIKSKMDIAKLLGGFMTLVLGGVILAPDRLEELSQGGDRWAVVTAAVAFLIAIGLYLRTMYAYDTLLMPTRYWGEAFPGRRQPRWLVRRPPSSAAWILYQNMLHVWTFLFTPATVAVAIGLLSLAYAALEPGWLEGLIASLVLLAFMVYALRRRPVLGSQD